MSQDLKPTIKPECQRECGDDAIYCEYLYCVNHPPFIPDPQTQEWIKKKLEERRRKEV